MGLKSFELSRGIRAAMLESARLAIQMGFVCPPRYRFHAACHWRLGTYAICEPSGEKHPSLALARGTSVAKPPVTGTVKSLETPKVKLERMETNRTRLPSGVQPTASSGAGW